MIQIKDYQNMIKDNVRYKYFDPIYKDDLCIDVDPLTGNTYIIHNQEDDPLSFESIGRTINEIKKRFDGTDETKPKPQATSGVTVKPKMKMAKGKKQQTVNKNEIKNNETVAVNEKQLLNVLLKNTPNFLNEAIKNYIKEHVEIQVVPFGALYDDKVGFFVELRIDGVTVSRSMIPISAPGLQKSNINLQNFTNGTKDNSYKDTFKY